MRPMRAQATFQILDRRLLFQSAPHLVCLLVVSERKRLIDFTAIQSVSYPTGCLIVRPYDYFIGRLYVGPYSRFIVGPADCITGQPVR